MRCGSSGVSTRTGGPPSYGQSCNGKLGEIVRPSASTIGEMLKRAGLSVPRKQRRRPRPTRARCSTQHDQTKYGVPISRAG